MNIRVAAPVLAVNGPLRTLRSEPPSWPRQFWTAAPRFHTLLARSACPTCWTGRVGVNVDCMGSKRNGELEGQSSINELLDQPIGDKPTQLPLPFHLQVRPGEFRRAS